MILFYSILLLAVVANCAAECNPNFAQRTCEWTGDPHYRSFDNTVTSKVNFQGTCLYVASKTVVNTQEEPFRVLVVNEHRSGTEVSWTKRVIVEYNGMRWRMNRNDDQVDGPVSAGIWTGTAASGGGFIPCIGPNVMYWRTNLPFTFPWDQILVCYNGDHHAAIRVPKQYCNELEGLCGNFDQIPANDWGLSGGGQAPNPPGDIKDSIFGDSWIVLPFHPDVPANFPQCNFLNGVFPPLNAKDARKARAVCRKKLGFRTTDKILATCKKSHPGIFRTSQMDCEFDVARGGIKKTADKNKLACDYLAVVVNECETLFRKGIRWRSQARCPIKCPSPTILSSSAPACPPSCADPRPNCPGSWFTESCVCPPGTIRKGNKCVDPIDCDDIGGDPCPPCTVRRDLTYDNRVFWGATTSTSGNWQDVLIGSPAGGLSTNSAMVTIVFKPANNLCFIPRNVCLKAKNMRQCQVSFECTEKSGLNRDASNFTGCLSATCKLRSLTIKCWNKKRRGTMTIWVSVSDILSK